MKDKVQNAYIQYETFEAYKRPKELNMKDYINEFERSHYKIKEYDMALPDGVWAYKLLKQAGLSETHEQLISNLQGLAEVSQVHVKLIPQINWGIRQEVMYVVVFFTGQQIVLIMVEARKGKISLKNVRMIKYMSVCIQMTIEIHI